MAMAGTVGGAHDARPMTAEERKVIIASSAGTVFEWYDFYLYGWTAAQIGKAFYSAFDANTQFICGDEKKPHKTGHVLKVEGRDHPQGYRPARGARVTHGVSRTRCIRCRRSSARLHTAKKSLKLLMSQRLGLKSKWVISFLRTSFDRHTKSSSSWEPGK